MSKGKRKAESQSGVGRFTTLTFDPTCSTTSAHTPWSYQTPYHMHSGSVQSQLHWSSLICSETFSNLEDLAAFNAVMTVFNGVRKIVPVVQRVLEASRKLGLYVMHTREGHLPDLSDLPASKRLRQMNAPNGHHTTGIGEPGPMGRLLVRGEYGHDVIDELRPLPGEVIIDKPGKGSFWKTDFHRALLNRGITHLLLAGVTTECCVNTTAREAADRGFECCILNDCTSGFDANLVTSANATICAYDGLFGYVGASTDLVELCESRTSLNPVTYASTALKSMSISDLSRAYRENTLRPVDVIQIAVGRASEYLRQNPDVGTILTDLDVLLQEAETLQQRFAGLPLPPLYGIPFSIARFEDYAEIDALVDAGALMVGSLPESSASVATLSVSFTLDSSLSSITQTGVSTGVTVFRPTSIDSRPPTHRETRPTAIVAQSSDEARMVWLVIAEQNTSDQEDTFVVSQAVINSWVWHIDFRGPKSGGFVFGMLRDTSCCSDASHHLRTQKAVQRVQAAGGQAQEIDRSLFERAQELNRNMYRLAVKEIVSLQAVLELQVRQIELSREVTRILETVDVLLDPLITCLCHSGSERAEQNHSLVDSLKLCGISVNPRLTHTRQVDQETPLMLMGPTGKDGRILDIARELENTML